MAKHASHSKKNVASSKHAASHATGVDASLKNKSDNFSEGTAAKSNNPRAQKKAFDDGQSTQAFGAVAPAGVGSAAAVADDEPKRGFFKRVFSKPSSAIAFIVVIVCVIAAIGCGAYVAWAQIEANKVVERDYGIPDTMAIGNIVDSASHEESVENPIDFATLQAQNPDVIAWITVPGTDVNLPILRSEEETDYYLRHDINKAYSIGGEAYIQNVNEADFTDPVTVVYGHTFSFNETMFTTLHNFEDPEFFEEHDTFYIYTPTRVLTYKIVSAYEFTNELITAKDFSDMDVREEYMTSVLNPNSENKSNQMTRSGSEIDVEKGRLVQLSTCTVPSSTVKRYLLNGVLEEEQLAYPKASSSSSDASSASDSSASSSAKAAA